MVIKSTSSKRSQISHFYVCSYAQLIEDGGIYIKGYYSLSVVIQRKRARVLIDSVVFLSKINQSFRFIKSNFCSLVQIPVLLLKLWFSLEILLKCISILMLSLLYIFVSKRKIVLVLTTNAKNRELEQIYRNPEYESMHEILILNNIKEIQL